MKTPRKLHIKSYGCQMNVYDAQRMVDTLSPEGFVETDSADDADLVILNTCHIREKASEKVYSELGRLRLLKDGAARHGRDMKIAVAGCVAQAEGEEIVRRAPVVDVVVGPQSYHHLPQLLARARRNGRALETEFPVEDKFGFLPPPKPDAIRARGISAFVTVQEGCDKFCTFCVVPYTRGAEVSRPVAKIIDDVMRLADNGVREITLIGQNVNAYHGEGPDGRSWPLGRLLERLASIPGVLRLRYSTHALLDIALDDRRMRGVVAVARHAVGVAVGGPVDVHEWRVGSQRGLEVVDHRQLLVLDLDQVDGLLCDLGRERGHRGDRVPLVAHVLLAEQAAVLHEVPVQHVWHVGVRRHGEHAGQGLGLGGVEPRDAAVRHTGELELRVQHAREVQVGRVASGARDLVRAVCTDEAPLGNGRQHCLLESLSGRDPSARQLPYESSISCTRVSPNSLSSSFATACATSSGLPPRSSQSLWRQPSR